MEKELTTFTPLAERMRPAKLEDLTGQEHLTGPGSILRKSIESGRIPSMILWGPPGTGKTTIATIIAHTSAKKFYTLSAISSGVKDLREVIDDARKHDGAIVFIDEIHRFNKGQQDALLGAVEKGTIILIGATTENPSFEVNSALLSRCQVFVLRPLQAENLKNLLHKAIAEDIVLSQMKIIVEEDEALFRFSGGDGRKLLNLLELTVSAAGTGEIHITNQMVMNNLQEKMALYDKTGEQHYDIISAFIKSMRGSDPNGAVYWLARMLEGGENIRFIARRMVILASEDIGNANPTALVLANACFEAVDKIGNPESRIILAQCAVYLATSPKSNSSYMAIEQALATVRQTGDLPVPLAIRNSPTGLMKNMGYGKDYAYAHDFEKNFVNQEYLPEQISNTTFFTPGKNAREDEIRKFLRERWKGKYGY